MRSPVRGPTGVAWRFALFFAEQAGKEIAQADCPERDMAMTALAVSAMGAYMETPSPERESRLPSLLRGGEAEQDESRRVGWNQVRMIRNRDLLVIENALRSIVFIGEAPTAICSGVAISLRASTSLEREIDQFWQNLQPRLHPAVPNDRTLLPG
jgi:hypothetical protein